MFDILSLKKQSPEKALEVLNKARACLVDEETKAAVLQAQLDNIGVAEYMKSVVTGEPNPEIKCPPDLLEAIQAQEHKVRAAKGVLNAAQAHYDSILAREAEKREAERKKKEVAVINDIRQAGAAVDASIAAFAEDVKAFRKA